MSNRISSKSISNLKNCVICGASARSQNYGAVTCEACKSFFRRSNNRNLHNTYRCINGSNCTIDMDDRKSCSYCRYQRCIEAGMDFGKAKSDKEKSMELMRKRTKGSRQVDDLQVAAEQLSQELLSLTNWHMPTLHDKGKFFSMMEIFDLDTLWGKYSHSFYNIPIKDESTGDPYATFENCFRIISAIGQRLFLFANAVPQFAELSDHDKKMLFRGGCSELCMVNSVLTFNISEGLWLAPTNRSTKFYKNVPAIDTGALLRTLGRELHEEKVDLTLKVLKFHPDETAVMLLFIILLFTPDRPGLKEVNKIHNCQMHFALLLKKYLYWRFGTPQGREVFQGLVTTLKDFHKIGVGIFEKIHYPIFRHPDNNYMGIS